MEKAYKILKLLIVVLTFAVVMVGAGRLYQTLSRRIEAERVTVVTQPGNAQETDAPSPAPDFTMYDKDGNAQTLSDFQGKPVVLNFWASWCGPCTGEMPEIQSSYESYGEQIQFLVVNLTDGSRETVDTASAYISEQGYTFPVYYDTDMDGAIAYGVNAIPVTYFIRADGSLVSWFQGAMTEAPLQKGIDLLLAE